jgi:hypothetical protein
MVGTAGIAVPTTDVSVAASGCVTIVDGMSVPFALVTPGVVVSATAVDVAVEVALEVADAAADVTDLIGTAGVTGGVPVVIVPESGPAVVIPEPEPDVPFWGPEAAEVTTEVTAGVT